MVQPIDKKSLAEAEALLALQQKVEFLYVFDEVGNQILKIEGALAVTQKSGQMMTFDFSIVYF